MAGLLVPTLPQKKNMEMYNQVLTLVALKETLPENDRSTNSTSLAAILNFCLVHWEEKSISTQMSESHLTLLTMTISCI